MSNSESTTETDELTSQNRIQPVERLPGDEHLADNYVPLRCLRENDYNPRQGYDDARMADFEASIKEDGLIQTPLVRPLDSDGERKEVIAGTRRLKALQRIYGADADVLVPVRVRDVNDREARRLALEENLAREPLTPLEEAHGLAEALTVDYGNTDEIQTFAEYIPDAKSSHVMVEIPSSDYSEITELADRTTLEASTIRNRLLLLILPKRVQTQVEQGALPLRVAERIADGLRTLPDPHRRREHIVDLADDPQYATKPDLAALKERIQTIVAAYERERNDEPSERIEALKQRVRERERELKHAVYEALDWYNSRDVVDEEVTTDDDEGLVGTAETIISASQDRIDELEDNDLRDIEDEFEARECGRDRLEENLSIVRSEGHDRCPFCRATVHASDIEDRIEFYEREIDQLSDQREALVTDRETFHDHRRDLRAVRRRYEEAVSELRQENERLDPDQAGTGS